MGEAGGEALLPVCCVDEEDMVLNVGLRGEAAESWLSELGFAVVRRDERGRMC